MPNRSRTLDSARSTNGVSGSVDPPSSMLRSVLRLAACLFLGSLLVPGATAFSGYVDLAPVFPLPDLRPGTGGVLGQDPSLLPVAYRDEWWGGCTVRVEPLPRASLRTAGGGDYCTPFDEARDRGLVGEYAEATGSSSAPDAPDPEETVPAPVFVAPPPHATHRTPAHSLSIATAHAPEEKPTPRVSMGERESTSVQMAAEPSEAPGVIQALSLLSAVAFLSLLGALAAYHRVGRSRTLNHKARAALYELLQREPGKTAQELASTLDLGLVNTRYHLRRMEKVGLVSSRRVRRRARYYVPGVEVDLKAVEVTTAPLAKRIVETVEASPGLPLRDLSRRLETPPPSCYYHLRNLVQAGVLVAEGEGREKVYLPVKHASQAVHRGVS